MSTKTKRRITVAEVKAAMEKTGARLKRGITFDPDQNCGCPIGVIAVASRRDPSPRACYIDNAQKALGLTYAYRVNFVQGFDRPNAKLVMIPADPEGWDDGRAVSLELLPPEKS